MRRVCFQLPLTVGFGTEFAYFVMSAAQCAMRVSKAKSLVPTAEQHEQLAMATPGGTDRNQAGLDRRRQMVAQHTQDMEVVR